MKRYIKSSETDFDFTEVYNEAYEIWEDTHNSTKVLSYLESFLGHGDAITMLNDIKETSSL